MSNNPLIEEKEQVKQILRGWRKVNNGVIALCISLCLFCIVLYGLILLFKFWKVPPILSAYFVTYLIMPLSTASFLWLYNSKRRRFIRQLTEEDKAILERASRIAPKSARKTATQVLRICENVRQADDRNLLRASVKAEDDTLLRAAQYAETAPQEKLLRPTDSGH